MSNPVESPQDEQLLTVSWQAMQGNCYKLKPSPAMLEPEGEVIKLKVQLKGMAKTGDNVSLVKFDRQYVLEYLSRYFIHGLEEMSEKALLELTKEVIKYHAANRSAMTDSIAPEWTKYVIS